MKVELHPAADAEFAAQVEYYEDRQPENVSVNDNVTFGGGLGDTGEKQKTESRKQK